MRKPEAGGRSRGRPEPGGSAGTDPRRDDPSHLESGGGGAACGPAPARSFEEEFQTAEEAVEHLERGDLKLEAALKEYEQGLQALSRCQAMLSQARKRIEVLAAGAGLSPGGAPAWVPAESVPVLQETILRIERSREIPRASEDEDEDEEAEATES